MRAAPLERGARPALASPHGQDPTRRAILVPLVHTGGLGLAHPAEISRSRHPLAAFVFPGPDPTTPRNHRQRAAAPARGSPVPCIAPSSTSTSSVALPAARRPAPRRAHQRSPPRAARSRTAHRANSPAAHRASTGTAHARAAATRRPTPRLAPRPAKPRPTGFAQRPRSLDPRASPDAREASTHGLRPMPAKP